MFINVLIISINSLDCYTFKDIRHAGCCAVMQQVLKFYIAFASSSKTKTHTHTCRFGNKQWKLQSESVTFVKCGVHLNTEAARVVNLNPN